MVWPRSDATSCGIAAPVEHALPGAREAGEAPPDVEVLEQEALNVVGLHGQKYTSATCRGRCAKSVVINMTLHERCRRIPRLALTGHDLYLFREGTHTRLYEKLGAHIVPDGARTA